jgi:HTH-type transcriptional regulator / antitoxin MqsA
MSIVCRAVRVRDTRDMPYTYKGESTLIPGVTGDFCPSCGEVTLDAAESARISIAMVDQHFGRSLDRTKQ